MPAFDLVAEQTRCQERLLGHDKRAFTGMSDHELEQWRRAHNVAGGPASERTCTIAAPPAPPSLEETLSPDAASVSATDPEGNTAGSAVANSLAASVISRWRKSNNNNGQGGKGALASTGLRFLRELKAVAADRAHRKLAEAREQAFPPCFHTPAITAAIASFSDTHTVRFMLVPVSRRFRDVARAELRNKERMSGPPIAGRVLLPAAHAGSSVVKLVPERAMLRRYVDGVVFDLPELNSSIFVEPLVRPGGIIGCATYGRVCSQVVALRSAPGADGSPLRVLAGDFLLNGVVHPTVAADDAQSGVGDDRNSRRELPTLPADSALEVLASALERGKKKQQQQQQQRQQRGGLRVVDAEDLLAALGVAVHFEDGSARPLTAPPTPTEHSSAKRPTEVESSFVAAFSAYSVSASSGPPKPSEPGRPVVTVSITEGAEGAFVIPPVTDESAAKAPEPSVFLQTTVAATNVDTRGIQTGSGSSVAVEMLQPVATTHPRLSGYDGATTTSSTTDIINNKKPRTVPASDRAFGHVGLRFVALARILAVKASLYRRPSSVVPRLCVFVDGWAAPITVVSNVPCNASVSELRARISDALPSTRLPTAFAFRAFRGKHRTMPPPLPPPAVDPSPTGHESPPPAKFLHRRNSSPALRGVSASPSMVIPQPTTYAVPVVADEATTLLDCLPPNRAQHLLGTAQGEAAFCGWPAGTVVQNDRVLAVVLSLPSAATASTTPTNASQAGLSKLPAAAVASADHILKHFATAHDACVTGDMVSLAAALEFDKNATAAAAAATTTTIMNAAVVASDDDDDDDDDDDLHPGAQQLPSAAMRTSSILRAASYLRTTSVVAKFNADTTGAINMPLLHVACEYGHCDAVELLILRGATVNQRDSQGLLPLHVAARRGHAACIPPLLKAGGPALANARDRSGRTPLHHALYAGFSNTALWLVEHGADPRVEDADGMSAADLACLRLPSIADSVRDGDAARVRLLLKVAMGLPIPRNTTATPTAAALWQRKPSNFNGALSVFDHSEDSREQWYVEQLRHKLTCGRLLLDIFGTLTIDARRGVVIENVLRMSALHTAVECGQHACMALLLQSPLVDVNARNADGNTALHRAVALGDVDAVDLVSRRPDCDGFARNHRGETPLHTALRGHQDADIVESLLLRFGNDPLIARRRDRFGLSPSHYAVLQGSEKLATAQLVISHALDGYEAQVTEELCIRVASKRRSKDAAAERDLDLSISSDDACSLDGEEMPPAAQADDADDADHASGNASPSALDLQRAHSASLMKHRGRSNSPIDATTTTTPGSPPLAVLLKTIEDSKEQRESVADAVAMRGCFDAPSPIQDAFAKAFPRLARFTNRAGGSSVATAPKPTSAIGKSLAQSLSGVPSVIESAVSTLSVDVIAFLYSSYKRNSARGRWPERDFGRFYDGLLLQAYHRRSFAVLNFLVDEVGLNPAAVTARFRGLEVPLPAYILLTTHVDDWVDRALSEEWVRLIQPVLFAGDDVVATIKDTETVDPATQHARCVWEPWNIFVLLAREYVAAAVRERRIKHRTQAQAIRCAAGSAGHSHHRRHSDVEGGGGAAEDCATTIGPAASVVHHHASLPSPARSGRTLKHSGTLKSHQSVAPRAAQDADATGHRSVFAGKTMGGNIHDASSLWILSVIRRTVDACMRHGANQVLLGRAALFALNAADGEAMLRDLFESVVAMCAEEPVEIYRPSTAPHRSAEVSGAESPSASVNPDAPIVRFAPPRHLQSRSPDGIPAPKKRVHLFSYDTLRAAARCYAFNDEGSDLSLLRHAEALDKAARTRRTSRKGSFKAEQGPTLPIAFRINLDAAVQARQLASRETRATKPHKSGRRATRVRIDDPSAGGTVGPSSPMSGIKSVAGTMRPHGVASAGHAVDDTQILAHQRAHAREAALAMVIEHCEITADPGRLLHELCATFNGAAVAALLQNPVADRIAVARRLGGHRTGSHTSDSMSVSARSGPFGTPLLKRRDSGGLSEVSSAASGIHGSASSDANLTWRDEICEHETGRDALQLAVELPNCTSIVRFLLGCGEFDPFVPGLNVDGYSAVHFAARTASCAALAEIVDRTGVSAANAVSRQTRMTPLHVAAMHGRVEQIQLLLNVVGSKPRAQCRPYQVPHTYVGIRDSRGRTPVILACRGGHDAAAMLLFDHGARVDAVDEKGETPVIAAARAGREQLALRVAERFGYGCLVAKNTVTGCTALHHAAWRGMSQLVDLFVSKATMTSNDGAVQARHASIAGPAATAGTPTSPWGDDGTPHAVGSPTTENPMSLSAAGAPFGDVSVQQQDTVASENDDEAPPAERHAFDVGDSPFAIGAVLGSATFGTRSALERTCPHLAALFGTVAKPLLTPATPAEAAYGEVAATPTAAIGEMDRPSRGGGGITVQATANLWRSKKPSASSPEFKRGVGLHTVIRALRLTDEAPPPASPARSAPKGVSFADGGAAREQLNPLELQMNALARSVDTVRVAANERGALPHLEAIAQLSGGACHVVRETLASVEADRSPHLTTNSATFRRQSAVAATTSVAMLNNKRNGAAANSNKVPTVDTATWAEALKATDESSVAGHQWLPEHYAEANGNAYCAERIRSAMAALQCTSSSVASLAPARNVEMRPMSALEYQHAKQIWFRDRAGLMGDSTMGGRSLNRSASGATPIVMAASSSMKKPPLARKTSSSQAPTVSIEDFVGGSSDDDEEIHDDDVHESESGSGTGSGDSFDDLLIPTGPPGPPSAPTPAPDQRNAFADLPPPDGPPVPEPLESLSNSAPSNVTRCVASLRRSLRPPPPSPPPPDRDWCHGYYRALFSHFTSPAVLSAPAGGWNFATSADLFSSRMQATLLWLSRHGHAPLLTSLLRLLPSVDTPMDAQGFSLLHYASFVGSATLVKELLGRDAQVNLAVRPRMTRHEGGITPLLLACYNCHLESATALLAAGADPNIPDECGNTPLHVVCTRRNFEMQKLMLHHDADITKQNHVDETPEDIAILLRDVDGMRLLRYWRIANAVDARLSANDQHSYLEHAHRVRSRPSPPRRPGEGAASPVSHISVGGSGGVARDSAGHYHPPVPFGAVSSEGNVYDVAPCETAVTYAEWLKATTAYYRRLDNLHRAYITLSNDGPDERSVPALLYCRICSLLGVAPSKSVLSQLRPFWWPEEVLEIDLSGIYLAPSGTAAFLSMLRTLPKLEHLDLSASEISSDGVALLCDCIVDHPSIRRVNLAGNKAVGRPSSLRILEALDRNRRLVDVDVHLTAIEASVSKHIAGVCERNQRQQSHSFASSAKKSNTEALRKERQQKLLTRRAVNRPGTGNTAAAATVPAMRRPRSKTPNVNGGGNRKLHAATAIAGGGRYETLPRTPHDDHHEDFPSRPATAGI